MLQACARVAEQHTEQSPGGGIRATTESLMHDKVQERAKEIRAEMVRAENLVSMLRDMEARFVNDKHGAIQQSVQQGHRFHGNVPRRAEALAQQDLEAANGC